MFRFKVYLSDDDILDVSFENTGQAEYRTRKQLVLKKWRVIYDFLKTHPGSRHPTAGWLTCFYCTRFLVNECQECPVFKKTGQRRCHRTPYREYQEAETWAEALKAARAEIKFLESLPDEEKMTSEEIARYRAIVAR
jgi:hypothetical protein